MCDLLAVFRGHVNVVVTEKLSVFILRLASVQHFCQEVGARSLTSLRYLAPGVYMDAIHVVGVVCC